jgi:Type IV secretion-system coupling protein DNA-binding domain
MIDLQFAGTTYFYIVIIIKINYPSPVWQKVEIAGNPFQHSQRSDGSELADPLSYRRADGTILRLPNYAPDAGFIEIVQRAGFQIRAKPLFPLVQPTDTQSIAFARFLLQIRAHGATCHIRRYVANETSLSAAVDQAQRWIDAERQRERFDCLFSPALFLWIGLLLFFSWFLSPIVGWISLAPPIIGLPFALYLAPSRRRKHITASLAGFDWDRNDFCRGWLVTGDTGSGKTFAINILLHSVFQNESDWGGLCCDEKGIYYETLLRMAERYGRREDLLLLQTRPDGASEDWIPPARFNLLSDETIPWSTYATVIVDTASALASGTEDKGFFKTQAHANIGRGIQFFRLLGLVPTMHHLLEMLQYQPVLRAMLQQLEPLKNAGNSDARECYDHFLNGYLHQPAEQLGGVISTIYNYLNYFTNSDISEVFGAEENSFDFSALDEGAILCISLPQKYQTERRYITTILKLLFYTHALRRFDPRPSGSRKLEDDNLLICWQDEAQRFITESDGNVDVIRQAQATTVLAAQSKLSFLPALGSKEKAEVTILNLRNRIIFKAADRGCAESSADFIGKRMIWKRSYTRGRGNYSTTRTREEEYRVKPFELMSLPKFTAIVKHCEKGFRKKRIHPIDAEGRTPSWYPFWRRWF